MSDSEKQHDALIAMRIVGLAMDPFNNSPIVLLKIKQDAKQQTDQEITKEDQVPPPTSPSSSPPHAASEPSWEESADDLAVVTADDLAAVTSDELPAALTSDELPAALTSDEIPAALTSDENPSAITRDELPAIAAEDLAAIASEEKPASTAEKSATTEKAALDIEALLSGMAGKRSGNVEHTATEEGQRAREDESDDRERDPRHQYLDETSEQEEREQLLPIWIGEAEANAIAIEMLGITSPRPLTHDLLKKLLSLLSGTLLRVIITDLRENTFYAALEIQAKDEIAVIDARPSDALALAVRCNAPIFVRADVLARVHHKSTPAPQPNQELDEQKEHKWQDLLRRLNKQSLDKYEQ